jgi:1-acyl-sn-glycerol-3-phosphate acyltransferase
MANAALGLYSYAQFGLCALAFLPIMGVAWHQNRLDPTQRIPGRWMRRFGRATSGLSPIWSFAIEGERPRDIDRRAYVVVSNHESTADPFLLAHLPWDMRWVAKQEIFDIPVIGQLMKYGGDIPLRRGDRSSVTEMMAECRRTLGHGMSVMMFPEGTRSADGSLGRFKPGAFDLAISAGVPVLPIAIAGTRACRPKGSMWFGKAHAIARVLEPLPTDGLGAEDTGALGELARARIERALPDLRDRVAEAMRRQGAPYLLGPSTTAGPAT